MALARSSAPCEKRASSTSSGLTMVDDDFVLLLDVVDGFAQLRVVEGLDGLLHDFLSGLVQRLVRDRLIVVRGPAQVLIGLFDVAIGVEAFDNSSAEFLDSEATG